MEEAPPNRFNHWMKESITVRLIAVGVIALILLIPLEFAKSLISERSFRQQEVVDKINGSWGSHISLQGPMIKVPYREAVTTTRFDPESQKETYELKWVTRHLYFLPDSLDIEAKADTDKLSYGIYQSVIFQSDIELSGTFGTFEYDSIAIPPNRIEWERASVILYCNSLKGIQEEARIGLEGSFLDFKPVYSAEQNIGQMETGFASGLNESLGAPVSFRMHLNMKGSEYIEFVPTGKVTRAHIESDWHSPGFTGEFLPGDDDKIISDKGFSANWKVLEINRNFGQTFTSAPPKFTDKAFRVEFVVPVDDYQKVTRAGKYGFLVISLTLFIFLMIQLLSKRYIHPLQYFLIGLGLVTFYTLLLSITEHARFLSAYLIAGSSVVLLISIYALSVLKSARTSLLVFLCLVLLYAFIYVIIQLEDYALLVGSVGTFLILAVIMFVTRNLDWSRRE